MNADFSDLLNQDIEKAQKALQKLLAQMVGGLYTLAIVEEGLIAAHTLKALAAVKGLSHIEQYAAQLEQLFLRCQTSGDSEIAQGLQTALKQIEDDFRQACELSDIAKSKKSLSQKQLKHLSRLVESLQHQEQQDKTLRRQSLEQKQNTVSTAELALECLFSGYFPWLYRAAESAGKTIEIDLELPQKIILPYKVLNPLQMILVHLLRNAIFHGIELPQQREIRGKSRTGTIQLSGLLEEGFLIIAISDDGMGISNKKIHPAIQLKSNPPNPSANPTSQHTAVETSIYATTNSQTGLGVGLHIVQQQAKALSGSFELKSIPGAGTSAIIKIPLDVCRVPGDE